MDMLYNRWFSRAAALGALVLSECADDLTGPRSRANPASAANREGVSGVDPAVIRAVRELAAARGIVPLARPAPRASR